MERLVAGDPPLPGARQHFTEIVGIEIADAPAADFPGAHQLLERSDGFRQRIRPTPMQQIAIEPVGFQPRQRTLARRYGAAPRGVARQNFRDQKDVVAAPGDRFGDHQLGIAIHLGGVDAGHAEIDATAQRGDRASAISAVDIPGALPDHGHVGTVLAEFLLSQDFLAEWITSSLTLLAMTNREY